MDTLHNIYIADYDYALPEERIAKFPLAQRDASQLLVCRHQQITSTIFSSLPDYIPAGSLMVFNNTRVIYARLHFRKVTGATIEIFLLEPAVPADYEQMFQSTCQCTWHCLVGNRKRWHDDSLSQAVVVDGQTVTLTAHYDHPVGTAHSITFHWDAPTVTWGELLAATGELPIPPYLHRAAQESDKTTYQTIYSKVDGSVAAPTAGLHFTPSVLAALDRRGITRQEVTLHVGAGTFQPVKSDEIHGHDMHTEHIAVTRELLSSLIAHHGRVTAVGTTTVRTVESLYHLGVKIHDNPSLGPDELAIDQWEPYQHDSQLTAIESLQEVINYLDAHGLSTLHTTTKIIIVPGYRYQIVNALVTNFHQPKSTLLLLVSAFIGDTWREVYAYALSHDYRFLSYGDACLFIP